MGLYREVSVNFRNSACGSPLFCCSRALRSCSTKQVKYDAGTIPPTSAHTVRA